MTQAGGGVKFLVAAGDIPSPTVPVGYEGAWASHPGQPYQFYIQSALNTNYQTPISSFGVILKYDFLTRQYTPDVVYNCSWTATWIPLN
jgi:hypothetical protein